MARGTSSFRTWDVEVATLQKQKTSFRICKRKGNDVIRIRQIEGTKVVREFSSGVWRVDDDDDIRAAARTCLESHHAGRWVGQKPQLKGAPLTWELMATRALDNLRARVAREGSRKNAEGHLRELSQKEGVVTVDGFETWCRERDPVKEPSAFRNRIETLSHIDKAGDIDLKDLVLRMRALKPKGAARKEQEQRTQKIKAIPTDEALEAWLDDLDGFKQWTLALIATYGLRPSEAWHAEGIDQQGWITIPGEGITKTERHFAPPQPVRWLERYQLRENFEKYQAELQERWPVRWTDRRGVQIPVNNSQVSNALYQEMEQNRIPRLYVGDEWLRPYDLRHSYAIRCETSTDPDLLATPREDFAKWLGHGVDVHERVYLKFIPRDRQLASMQTRYGRAKQNPADLAGLPDDIQAKLAKLEQLEKLLNS